MREGASWAFMVIVSLLIVIMGITGRVGIVLGCIVTPDIVQVVDAKGNPIAGAGVKRASTP